MNTPPLPAPTTRQDIAFPSADTTCRGWLTYPAAAGPVPLVLMAHGFGATH